MILFEWKKAKRDPDDSYILIAHKRNANDNVHLIRGTFTDCKQHAIKVTNNPDHKDYKELLDDDFLFLEIIKEIVGIYPVQLDQP